MKSNLGLLTFLYILTFGSINAQDLNVSAVADSLQLPASRTPYEISFTISDSTDVSKIDSIITRLDSVLAPKSDIYGHNLLSGEKFIPQNPSDVAQVGSHYVIGAGDEITISIFGAAQFDARFVVNEQGFIAPTNMPKIFLKGVSWGKAQDLIKSRFKQFFQFRDNQFSAALSNPRDITVHLVGEVNNPGSYQMNAIHTAIQALTLAGGVTDIGSVRNINLVDGSESKTLDLYKLLNDPSGLVGFNLTDDLVIQVPVAEKIVKITGMKRAMKFELLQSENLDQLITYAGGFKANAVKDFAQIARYIGGVREIIDVDLTERSTAALKQLQDGDEVTIRTIDLESQDVIKARGAMDFPGTYSLKHTSKLSDLLSKISLSQNANLEEAFLIRQNANSTSIIELVNLSNVMEDKDTDIPLQAGDELVVQRLSSVLQDAFIKVRGAVQREVQYPFSIDSSLTVRKALLLAGGLRRDAANEGYIIRRDIENEERIDYIPVDIKSAYRNPKSKANILLAPNDELLILDQEDFTDKQFVSISGAVRNPDKLLFSLSLSIADVLKLSGGLTSSASGVIDVYRIEIKNGQPVRTVSRTLQVESDYELVGGDEEFELQPDDELVARTQEEYNRQILVSISGEVRYKGRYAITERNESIDQLIQKAGGVTDQANTSGIYIERIDPSIDTYYKVVVDGQSQNIILQAGDHIIVPKKSNTVSILTHHTQAFNRESTLIEVPFAFHEDAKWYIDQYVGGLKNKGDRAKITVEYANGAVRSARKKLFSFNYPIIEAGATIMVRKDTVREERVEQGDYPRLRRGVIINLGDEHDSETEIEEPDNE